MAAAMPVISTRVLNTVMPVSPTCESSTQIVERVAETTMPKAGTPRVESRSNRSGNKPSLDAASGTSAASIVQPLRAPKPDTTTRKATRAPTHEAPLIVSAAVANGAVDAVSATLGRMPKIATSESR